MPITPGYNRDPLRLPGEENVPFDFGETVPENGGEAVTQAPSPKAWYSKVAEVVSDFFSSVFSRINQAVQSARETVLRIFSPGGEDIHVNTAIRNIRDTTGRAPSVEKQRPTEPDKIEYFEPRKKTSVQWAEEVAITSAEPMEKKEGDVELDGGPSNKTEVPPESSPKTGSENFTAFLSLYQQEPERKDLPDFVFHPECIAHAKDIARSALGKNPETMPNANAIRAAKLIIEADSKRRSDQEANAAREIREQQQLKEAEELSAKVPGQADFEAFLGMYRHHVQQNTYFIIHEGSKFLTQNCLSYADQLLTAESGEQAKAALYLSMWRANPAGAMERASRASAFELPPPPAPASRRLKHASVVKPAWESVLSDLKNLEETDRVRLAGILQISSGDLNQWINALVTTTAHLSKPLASGPSSGNHRRASPPPVATGMSEIDELQQAQYLVDKLRQAERDGRLDIFAAWAESLKASWPIEEAIKRRLEEQLPKQKPQSTTSAFEVPDLGNLSTEQIDAAAKDFDSYTKAFNVAIKAGRVYKFTSGSKYLNPVVVAVAQSFVESVGRAQGLKLDEAHEEKLGAASFLVNEAQKLASKVN